MQYHWDINKNDSNQLKHKVSFELAQLIFNDIYHFTLEQQQVNYEERLLTIGKYKDIHLTVAHTYYIDSLENEHIRIISARKATKAEIQKYVENYRRTAS